MEGYLKWGLHLCNYKNVIIDALLVTGSPKCKLWNSYFILLLVPDVEESVLFCVFQCKAHTIGLLRGNRTVESSAQPTLAVAVGAPNAYTGR